MDAIARPGSASGRRRREALADGFERLGPESPYRRFFGPVPHLSERDLDMLTRVDHRDHEALVAVVAATGGHRRRPVLAYNAEAIRLLSSLGETMQRPDGREVQLTIDFPKAEPAARLRRLLQQFAIGTLEPARALLERFWPPS